MSETSELHPSDVERRSVKRTFTVQQANKTLPLVSRIVGDVVAVQGEMTKTQQQIAEEPAVSTYRDQLEARAIEQEVLLERYADELASIGCELKDAKIGLVDFTGRHEGRDVCLCWRLGEEKIAYWHEVHTGFAGRREIASIREP